MILLRRREGRNWFHVHNVASAVANPAGEAVLRAIEACDFLDRCGSDESLLNSTLRLAPQISLEHRFSRADNQWQPDRSLLRLTDGLPMDTEIDPPVMAFLNGFDGVTTTRDCIERFATATSADVANLTEEFLPIVRMFVQRGFLQPANRA